MQDNIMIIKTMFTLIFYRQYISEDLFFSINRHEPMFKLSKGFTGNYTKNKSNRHWDFFDLTTTPQILMFFPYILSL